MNSYPQFPAQITIFTASNFYYIYVQIGFLKSRVLCNCDCELQVQKSPSNPAVDT